MSSILSSANSSGQQTTVVPIPSPALAARTMVLYRDEHGDAKSFSTNSIVSADSSNKPVQHIIVRPDVSASSSSSSCNNKNIHDDDEEWADLIEKVVIKFKSTMAKKMTIFRHFLVSHESELRTILVTSLVLGAVFLYADGRHWKSAAFKLSRENAILQAKSATIMAANARLLLDDSDSAMHLEQMATLVTDLQQNNEALRFCKTVAAALEDEVLVLKKENSDSAMRLEQMATLETDLQQNKETLQFYKNATVALEDEVSVLKKENSDSAMRLEQMATLETDLQQNKEVLQAFKTAAAVLQDEILVLEKERKPCIKPKEDPTKATFNMRQFQDMKKDLHDARRDLKSWESSVEALKENIGSLETEVTQHKRTIKALMSAMKNDISEKGDDDWMMDTCWLKAALGPCGDHAQKTMSKYAERTVESFENLFESLRSMN